MKFEEIPTNTFFIYNGEKYQKITPEKVTCCRTNNAMKVHTQEKVMIRKNPDVELDNSEQQ